MLRLSLLSADVDNGTLAAKAIRRRSIPFGDDSHKDACSYQNRGSGEGVINNGFFLVELDGTFLNVKSMKKIRVYIHACTFLSTSTLNHHSSQFSMQAMFDDTSKKAVENAWSRDPPFFW